MSSRAPHTRSYFSRCRLFAKNREGTAAVQFALVAPLFFALLFAIMETALVFFAGQALETGVHDSARLIMTGQAQLGNTTQAQFKQKICDRITSMFSCDDLYVEVAKQTSFSDFTSTNKSACDPLGTGGYTIAGPGDVVMVRALYKWPLFVTSLGYFIGDSSGGVSCNKRLLVSTAVFRNEP